MNISTDAVIGLVENYLGDISDSVRADTTKAQTAFTDTLSALATDMLQNFVAANAGENGEAELALEDVEAIVDSYLAGDSAAVHIASLDKSYSMGADAYASVYRPLLMGMLSSHVASELAEDMAGNLVPAMGAEDLMPVEETTWQEEDVPPSEEATQPPEDETEPSQEPSEPEPTEEPTEPSQEPTEPSQEPTEPSQKPTEPESTEPGETEPEVNLMATVSSDEIPGIVSGYLSNTVVNGTSAVMAGRMAEAQVQQTIMDKLNGVDDLLMSYIGGSFYVDEEMLASAFQFEMDEEELRRLMEAMSPNQQDVTNESNLRSLGYADLAQPTAISIYLIDFAGKEEFLAFLDGYNADMEAAGKEEQVISYTDITGIMMSSVRTIIDSVSYVLIAFVAVSLVVSSIMIGIITYISVMERTKEIGVLRAIGASKRNISQVFNAETFIIGLCSGIIGVGTTLILNYPINQIIHNLTENSDINAQLPAQNAAILVLLSMILTLIGGFIPSKQAAKKDPVIALRSE